MESCTNTPVAQKYATLNNVYIFFFYRLYTYTHEYTHTKIRERVQPPVLLLSPHMGGGQALNTSTNQPCLAEINAQRVLSAKNHHNTHLDHLQGEKKKTTTKKDKVQNILSRVQYFPRPWGHHRRRPEEARSEKMDTKSSSTLTGQGLPRNFTLTKPFLHSFCLLHGASPSWLLWVLCPFGVQAQLNRHFHYS